MPELIEDLERLKALKEQGHLTDGEFQIAKERILSFQGKALHQHTPDLTDGDEAGNFGGDAGDSSRRGFWLKLIAAIVIFFVVAVGAYIFEIKRKGSAEVTATVEGENLNCRTGPSLDAPIQEVLAKDTPLVIAERKNGWASVEGKDCWVSEQRIKVTEQITPASAETTDLNDESLIPARYDLTTNPNIDAVKLARRLLNGGYQCVLGPTREIGQTYAILDTGGSDVKYVTKALTGDLLEPHEAHVEINDIQIETRGEDGGMLSDNTLRVSALEKAENGDILMFAEIIRGSWSSTPLWWMRCGDQSMGSAEWWKNFTVNNEMINLAYD